MKSAANTPPTYYLDTPAAKSACANERRDIQKKCKPEAPQSDKDKKNGIKRKRKSGLSGKLAEAGEALDDLGKASALYKRDKGSRTATDGNAWMADHCTGLWITPSDTFDPNFEKQLTDVMAKIEDNRLGMMWSAFDELKAVAIEKAGAAAIDKAEGFAARSIAKGVVGAAGVETGIVTVAMAAWTAHDLYSTGKELAALAGAKGQAALDAISNIKNIGEKASKILGDYKDNPHKAHADAMSLMAQIDPCTRARKCMLVPFQNTDGKPTKAVAQANHGNGCCPGQTGHHILPNAMVEGAGCTGYDYDTAPTICLEGCPPRQNSCRLARI